MPVLDRSLTVALDGEPLSFSGRMRLQGKDALSMFPALFTLELWNLPEELYLRLSRCRDISVSHGDACLVSGRVWDVYRRGSEEGVLTSVSISIGLELWESVVSLTVPAGTSFSDAVRQILSASGTGIPLLADLENDSVLVRSWSFFGRAPECIDSVLSAVSAWAMLTPSGLMIVSATSIGATAHRADRLFRLTSALSKFPTLAADSASPDQRPQDAIHITEADLTDAPAFAGGSLYGSPSLMILSAAVSGWRPGQTAEVDYKDVHARGIITERSVDADTASGPWVSQMICEVL